MFAMTPAPHGLVIRRRVYFWRAWGGWTRSKKARIS